MYQFAEFHQKFDEHFFSFLDSQQNHYQEMLPHPNIQRYFQTVRTAATGGKRIRPYVAWVCLSKKLEEVSECEWRILTAIEIIHLFALIHDDLMDKSPTRRGVPTAHTAITRRLEEQGHQGDVVFGGRMIAMLAGDIVFWSASTLLSSTVSEIGSDLFKKLHNRFTLLINDVVLGQALDFDQAFRSEVSREEVRTKTIHKTGHYTFSYPMQIGGLLASYRADQLEILYEAGEKIGLGFQIQDDILDIVGDPNQTQKPVMADISNGQHTLLTAYIKEEGTPEQQRVIQKYWRKKIGEESFTTLQDTYRKSGAVKHAQEIADSSYGEAIKIINKGDFKDSVKINLTNLIQYLASRDH